MSMHRLLALALLAVAVSSGCARTHLFYDTRELRHEPLEKRQKQALVRELADDVDGKRLVWVDPDGRERTLSSDVAGLSDLPLAELGALWLATSGGEPGGEHDMRVRVGRERSVPVSVLRDLEGNITIVSAPEDAGRRRGAALSLDEIRKRFGLEHELKGKWAPVERLALAEGLALLSPDELRRVRAVRFERRKLSPDGDPSRGAFFVMEGCRAVIYLYSSGVAADRYRFTGDARAPKSAMLHSLLHEIGHAIEQSAARERYCKAKGAHVTLANRLIAEGNALVESSPALAAYLAALGDAPAPTDYGATSGHESFAESFALYRVDPAALERARPSAYRWFAEGGHLKALEER